MTEAKYGVRITGRMGGTVVVEQIIHRGPAPEVFTARFAPADVDCIRGYGTTAAEAITDLFRAERDQPRPLPLPSNYLSDTP